MNKKGAISISMVLAIFLGIVLLIFLGRGGAATISGVTGVISKIPGWAWLIILVIFIFKRWGK